jgi:hypothetical protein
MGITVPLLFAHVVFGAAPHLYSGAQIGLLLGTLGAAALGGIVLLSPRPLPDPPEAAQVDDPARATVPSAPGVPPAPDATIDPKEGRAACEPD